MRTVVSQFGLILLLVCLNGAGAVDTPAQTPAQPPKAKPPISKPGRVPIGSPTNPRPPESRRGSYERSIAVDPSVNIQLPCVTEAHIRINGWKRDEVRVFVRGGTNIGFKVHEQDPRSGKPIWLEVKGSGGVSPMAECVTGDRIDIEAPTGASLKINGREINTQIDSVRKVEIKSIGGNVALRNISGGISAETFEGDVTVENSSGQIALRTTTGNILAYGVTPGQVGDVFKAATSNGLITLQNVDHRQIDANSVTGDLLFEGKFLPGGIYSFKTSDGAIRLAIPKTSSLRMIAWFGFGAIESAIPYETVTSNISSGGKSLNALIGSGDATVNLTTTRGRISISKHEPQP